MRTIGFALLLIAAACRADDVSAEPEGVKASVVAPTAREDATPPPSLASIAGAQMLEGFEKVREGMGSTHQSRQEVQLAGQQVGGWAQREQDRGAFRSYALEKGADSSELDAALASREQAEALQNQAFATTPELIKAIQLLKQEAASLPSANEIDGGCARLADKLRAYLGDCLPVAGWGHPAGADAAKLCPDLGFEPEAHVRSCAEGGHAWAADEVERIEKRG